MTSVRLSCFLLWTRDPPFVSLIDGREINVGQQRRYDSPLRGSCHWMPTVAFDHDVGLQEGENEPQDLPVPDAATHPLHQHMMIDGIEAALDIALDHVAGQCWPVTCRVQTMPDSLQRIMGTPTGPEAVRGRVEVRLEDWLQHHFERRLDQSILERWNP